MTAAGKGPETTKHQVFISYASDNNKSTTSDRQVADQVCASLESQGIRCWIAHRDILPGADWMEAIIDAVEQTKIIVLVFSENTEKSQWVKDEIKLALEENRTIIPFRIQDVVPRRALKLLKVRCHWMDAYTPPLEKHIERLIKVVSRHLDIEPVIPIKKEKIKDQLAADQVKPAAKKIKAVKEKIKEPAGMPNDVKNIVPKAKKVEKNKNGCWEAYYQDGIVMVYIPPGKFIMGSDEEYKREKPSHEVELDSYWMGKFLVTNAQYVTFLNDSGIHYKIGCQGEQCIDTDKESIYSQIKGSKGKYHVEKEFKNHPVIMVSWYGAVKYCEWLSKKTSLSFKLPTEAQWEKAARGNDKRKYPWGSQEPDKKKANFDENIGKTTPVGSYPAGASPYALLDMAGNVWEWCEDWYDEDYYKNSPPKNPAGPESGSNRVIRGGSWYLKARYLRCANRDDGRPSFRFNILGFRLRQDI